MKSKSDLFPWGTLALGFCTLFGGFFSPDDFRVMFSSIFFWGGSFLFFTKSFSNASSSSSASIFYTFSSMSILWGSSSNSPPSSSDVEYFISNFSSWLLTFFGGFFISFDSADIVLFRKVFISFFSIDYLIFGNEGSAWAIYFFDPCLDLEIAPLLLTMVDLDFNLLRASKLPTFLRASFSSLSIIAVLTWAKEKFLVVRA